MNLFEVSGSTTAAFWAASALAIGAAVMVVTVKNVFRASIFLAFSFIGVAGLYFVLSAEFIGIVQILVYVGAVSVLVAFAVMLVRDVSGGNRSIGKPVVALVIAALVGASLIFVAYETSWQRIDDIANADAVAGLAGTYVGSDAPGLPSGESIVSAAGADALGAQRGVFADTTGVIGTLLIKDFLLAFEIIGMVLTAALIGALVIMRERRTT